MIDTEMKRVEICETDMVAAATALESRFTEGGRESDRMQLSREFLHAAFELERAVHRHSHCALVNHRGTIGANSLVAATNSLFEALSEYAATMHEMALRFSDLLPTPEADEPASTRPDVIPLTAAH